MNASQSFVIGVQCEEPIINKLRISIYSLRLLIKHGSNEKESIYTRLIKWSPYKELNSNKTLILLQRKDKACEIY